MRYLTFYSSLYVYIMLSLRATLLLEHPQHGIEILLDGFLTIAVALLALACLTGVWLISKPDERRWSPSWEVLLVFVGQALILLFYNWTRRSPDEALVPLFVLSFVLLLRGWIRRPDAA